MKRIKQVLLDTRFKNDRLEPVGIEVMSASSLCDRVPEGAERVDFFMLLVVKAGHGSHLVDFERVGLRPGRVVVVKPGQVQHWRLTRNLDAQVILIQPSTLAPSGATARPATQEFLQLAHWPASLDLDTRESASAHSLMRMLEQELATVTMTEVSTLLARELLVCLLLGMGRAAARQSTGASEQAALVRRYQQALDETVYQRPSVHALARRLKVSTSTLARNCRDELGRSAKDVLDRRVALEAQRLLVHTHETAAAVGERLGFSEPTNFVKFFRRVTGTTPEAFRRAHRPR